MLCSPVACSFPSVSVLLLYSVQCDGVAAGDQRRQVAPSIARLDQVHAVPLERPFDNEFCIHCRVEVACGLVGGDHPDDHAGGLLRGKRCRGDTEELAAEPQPLVRGAQVERREVGVEPELRLGEHDAGGKAEHAVRILGDEYLRALAARRQRLVPQRGTRLDGHRVEISLRNHPAVRGAPALDAHARDRDGVVDGGAANADVDHGLSVPLTAAATCSAVNPKCLNSTPAGADSPNRSRPTTAACGSSSAPTYLRQPAPTPASTATRATPCGNTLAR